MKKYICILLLIASVRLTGNNVDLVTLPVRDGVTLTVYNSADLTLVRETRTISVKKGKNRLLFSWHGTKIDPSSVLFEPVTHRQEIELEHTSFPGGKPQHLIWHIKSEVDGQVRVSVSYFTSGLTWNMDYTAVVYDTRNKVQFSGFVRIYNNSGEDYPGAAVRLIVGKINLVEKIADLASRRGLNLNVLDEENKRRLRRDVLRSAFRRAESVALDEKGYYTDKKKIVKEGLSEYFMFTIPGQETIRHGWSKRMRALHSDRVNFREEFRLNSQRYGSLPVRFLIWKNDKKQGLGESPLPDGILRLYSEDGTGLSGWLGKVKLNFVPMQAPLEVNLGQDPLISAGKSLLQVSRRKFSVRYRSYSRTPYIQGWDLFQEFQLQAVNRYARPISLIWEEQFPGDVELAVEGDPVLQDYRTVKTVWRLEPGQRLLRKQQVLTRQGKNRIKDRVKLSALAH